MDVNVDASEILPPFGRLNDNKGESAALNDKNEEKFEHRLKRNL